MKLNCICGERNMVGNLSLVVVKRRVIMWLQNHWRSRHERQINFPELCMSDSLQSGTRASTLAIPSLSLFACANTSIRAIIFVQAQRDYYL